MRFLTPILIFLTLLLANSCNDKSKNYHRKSIPETKKTFERINKTLVSQDRALIENYIKRYKLDSMKESGTGLYYYVWGEPTGDTIKTGNTVEYLYKISLLDGTICYQSEDNIPKRFTVGHGVNVENGLEQAVLLMCPGQKGKFIMPPHLAYGLIGDNNKIPARTIIVYDIEMIKVYR